VRNNGQEEERKTERREQVNKTKIYVPFVKMKTGLWTILTIFY
jgi:hypothetical protein